MTAARFSRIVIIQSLPPSDSPTGRNLRDAIESTAVFNHSISVEFTEARTATDFFKALAGVQATAENTTNCPILHLECHGLSDKTGLSLGDGTSVPWVELKPVLERLNQATGCNLFVTLAACHGAMLFETLDVFARAPCWGLIGPSGEVSPADLVSSYSAFYLELFQSGNADAALSSLHNSLERRANYFLFTAEEQFRAVFQSYRATCSTSAHMVERAERFARVFEKHGMLRSGVGSLTAHLYEAEHDVLERFYTRFFFVDLFPENKARFIQAYSALAP